ncbi:MAG: sugar transporter permease, partial [Dactylosporangium sp.]|nr:sugar transporter permease [Dactylosporangium sp.]
MTIKTQPVVNPPRRHAGGGNRKAPSIRSEVRILSRLGRVALMLWALVVIGPILWTFLASFKSTAEIFSSPWTLPAELRWENWSRAWTQAHVGRYFLNSVIVVGFSTFGTMLLGSMAAFVLARYKFFGNRFIYFLFVSGLAFPPFLALVPLFKVVQNFGLLNTYTGLVLVYIA